MNLEYFGFSGRILEVNLSSHSFKFIPLNLKYGEKFLGGAGYACRYLINKIEKRTDPLSPKNVLMIMNGPLSMTGAPSVERFVICSKSPYTKLWGEANCGGSFGSELKRAGYDGIIIEGRSNQPVYLQIYNDKVKFLDAAFLWGRGIKSTREELIKITDSSKILCIGQAGENLVKYANINAENRSAGRTGMGTVMGSKNLKAITLKGEGFKPRISELEKFKKTAKKIIKFILNSETTQILRGIGTSAGVVGSYSVGDLPIKYWTKGTWNEVSKISGESLKSDFFAKNKSCPGCSIGCRKILKIQNGKSNSTFCEGPEYETLAGFGSMILNNDLESIVIANHICNDFGLDTISTSSVISLLYKIYDQKRGDFNGLDLHWGSSKPIFSLLRKIAYRDGIGNLLAEGSNKIGEIFGIKKEEIATVNNLEVPYHDLRYCYGMALTYAFSPRGACHTTGDAFKVLRPGFDINFSDLGIKKISLDSNGKETIINTILLQDYRSLYSSIISCFFSNPPPSLMVDLVNELMDWDLSIEDFKLMGERIFNLKRMFNIKMGLKSSQDHIPEILLRPLKEGPIKNKAPNFPKLKKMYYKYRNWDSKTGTPTNRKLKFLDMNL